jgi:hypothetical protein
MMLQSEGTGFQSGDRLHNYAALLMAFERISAVAGSQAAHLGCRRVDPGDLRIQFD